MPYNASLVVDGMPDTDDLDTPAYVRVKEGGIFVRSNL